MNYFLDWASFFADRFQVGYRMMHDQYWYVFSSIWKYHSVKRIDKYEGTKNRIKIFLMNQQLL